MDQSLNYMDKNEYYKSTEPIENKGIKILF